jgi:dual specificity phosphatase 3
MSSPLSSIKRPRRPESPQKMWREICWVDNFLAVSGDLPSDPEKALEQLRVWEAEGITDVFDMREERDDSAFIHANSSIKCHWFGVDDNGGVREDAWFNALCERAYEVLNDTTAKRRMLVHCHMGVNRGPSALFAIMIATGWGSLEALRRIRDVRPIAGIIYAPDAMRWWALDSGYDDEDASNQVEEVRAWLSRNDLDLHYVIRAIGARLAN